MTELAPAAAAFADHLRHRLIPAVLTPMRADGSLDRAVLEAYAASITGGPIGAIAAWAHTGRGPYLTREHRRCVMSTFAATAAPVIAGVAAPTDTPADPQAVLDATLRIAGEAVELGARALMVFPPVLMRGSPDRDGLVLRLHRAIAEEFQQPLVLFYLHAGAGGFAYDPSLLRDLFSIPHVMGIKLATMDAAVTCQDVFDLVRAEFPGRLAITGEDRMFGPSFMWGAEAALVGIAAALPELSEAVVKSWSSGDGGFVQASDRLDRLAKVTFREPIEGYIQRMFWVAVREGRIPEEHAHDPFGPRLAAEERAQVEAAVDQLMAR